jgi:hypothetical protein
MSPESNAARSGAGDYNGIGGDYQSRRIGLLSLINT